MKTEQEREAERERKRRTHRAWVAKNKERLKEYHREYRKKNREKILAYAREYWKSGIRPETKKRAKERSRLWQINNREYHKEHYLQNKEYYHAKTCKRRAVLAKRIHPDADMGEIAKIYKERMDVSRKTKIIHAVDHIIPISAGGYHHQDNMQIMPATINKEKGADPFWSRAGFKSWRNVPKFLWPQKLFESYSKIANINNK